jgi:hypothetical protein
MYDGILSGKADWLFAVEDQVCTRGATNGQVKEVLTRKWQSALVSQQVSLVVYLLVCKMVEPDS